MDSNAYELARTLPAEQIPVKFRCATCNQLAVDAAKLPCCSQVVCGPCQEELPSSCPVCSHEPISKEECEPAKSTLRQSIIAFLKKEERKRHNDTRTAELASKSGAPESKELETSKEAAEGEGSISNLHEKHSVAAKSDERHCFDAPTQVQPQEAQKTTQDPQRLNDSSATVQAVSDPAYKSDTEWSIKEGGASQTHASGGQDTTEQTQNHDPMMNSGYGSNNAMNGFDGSQWGAGNFNPMMGMQNNMQGWNGFPNMMGMQGMNGIGMDPSISPGMFGGFNGQMMGMNGMNMNGMNGMNGMGMGYEGNYGHWNGPSQMGMGNMSGGYFPSDAGYNQQNMMHGSQHFNQMQPHSHFPSNRNHFQPNRHHQRGGFNRRGRGRGDFGHQQRFSYGAGGFHQGVEPVTGANAAPQSQSRRGSEQTTLEAQLENGSTHDGANVLDTANREKGISARDGFQGDTSPKPGQGPNDLEKTNGTTFERVSSHSNEAGDASAVQDVKQEPLATQNGQEQSERQASTDAMDLLTQAQPIATIDPSTAHAFSHGEEPAYSAPPHAEEFRPPRGPAAVDVPSRGRGYTRGGFGRGSAHNVRGGAFQRRPSTVPQPQPVGVGVEGAPTGPKGAPNGRPLPTGPKAMMRGGASFRGRGGGFQAPAVVPTGPRATDPTIMAPKGPAADRQKPPTPRDGVFPTTALRRSRSITRSRSASRSRRQSRHQRREDEYNDRDREYASEDPPDHDRKHRHRHSRKRSRDYEDETERREHRDDQDDEYGASAEPRSHRRHRERDDLKDVDDATTSTSKKDRPRDRDRDRDRSRERRHRRRRSASPTGADEQEYRDKDRERERRHERRREREKEKEHRSSRRHHRSRSPVPEVELTANPNTNNNVATAANAPGTREFKIHGASKLADKQRQPPSAHHPQPPPSAPSGPSAMTSSKRKKSAAVSSATPAADVPAAKPMSSGLDRQMERLREERPDIDAHALEREARNRERLEKERVRRFGDVGAGVGQGQAVAADVAVAAVDKGRKRGWGDEQAGSGVGGGGGSVRKKSRGMEGGDERMRRTERVEREREMARWA
ncbi:MAG: hypothetical protein M1831_005090 [Alyxoria varia]|nr:MAG: hypothetical protein M1831_005090 [Alyxoria varia]